MDENLKTGLGKVKLVLVPFIFLVYVTSYLDRVNVAFAAPTMAADLSFTPAIYGFAAGVFFLTYSTLEVPSSLMAQRFGTRIWLTRIMLTWGILASMTALVQNDWQFYIVRFLLGAAEAGAFPILMFYLALWIPKKQIGEVYGWFIGSVAFAGLIGAPLSSLLLSLDGVLYLHGWQWLFFAEGIPAVILGMVVYAWLPDKPSQARWLSSEQKASLEKQLSLEQETVESSSHGVAQLKAGLKSGRVWALGLLAFFELIGLYSVSLWLPIFINNAFPNTGTLEQGLLNAIPYAFAMIALVVVGKSSDKFNERTWHLVGCLLIAIVAILGCAYLGVGAGYWLIVLATGAIYALSPVIWSLGPRFLTGKAAAAGFALLNCIGAVGGFVGPYSVGLLVQANDGDVTWALIMVAISLSIAAVIAYFVSRRIDAPLKGTAAL